MPDLLVCVFMILISVTEFGDDSSVNLDENLTQQSQQVIEFIDYDDILEPGLRSDLNENKTKVVSVCI